MSKAVTRLNKSTTKGVRFRCHIFYNADECDPAYDYQIYEMKDTTKRVESTDFAQKDKNYIIRVFEELKEANEWDEGDIIAYVDDTDIVKYKDGKLSFSVSKDVLDKMLKKDIIALLENPNDYFYDKRSNKCKEDEDEDENEDEDEMVFTYWKKPE